MWHGDFLNIDISQSVTQFHGISNTVKVRWDISMWFCCKFTKFTESVGERILKIG